MGASSETEWRLASTTLEFDANNIGLGIGLTPVGESISPTGTVGLLTGGFQEEEADSLVAKAQILDAPYTPLYRKVVVQDYENYTSLLYEPSFDDRGVFVLSLLQNADGETQVSFWVLPNSKYAELISVVKGNPKVCIPSSEFVQLDIDLQNNALGSTEYILKKSTFKFSDLSEDAHDALKNIARASIAPDIASILSTGNDVSTLLETQTDVAMLGNPGALVLIPRMIVAAGLAAGAFFLGRGGGDAAAAVGEGVGAGVGDGLAAAGEGAGAGMAAFGDHAGRGIGIGLAATGVGIGISAIVLSYFYGRSLRPRRRIRRD